MKPLFLFVRPPRPLWPFNGPSTAFWPPLAFASLAAALRDSVPEMRVAILDAPALAMGWNSLAQQLRQMQPDYVAIGEEAVSCVEGLRIAKLAKQLGARVIAGGCFFSHVASQVLATGLIDVVVHGEGERTIVELARALQSRDAKALRNVRGISFLEGEEVVFTGWRELIADLDELPFPAYDLLPMKKYGGRSRNHERMATIELGRGCSNGCEFCILWRQMGRLHDERPVPCLRVKSAERLLEEARILMDRFQRRYLAWVDPCFNADPQAAAQFADLMLKEDRRIGQSAWVRADHLLRDDASGALGVCVESGWNEAYLGLERLERSELGQLHKGNLHGEAERALQTLDRKYPKVVTVGSFIYGFPWETPESVRWLFRRAKRLPLDVLFFIPLTPLPGTPYWRPEMWDPTGERFRSFDFLPRVGLGGSLAELSKEIVKGYLFCWPAERVRRTLRGLLARDGRRRRITRQILWRGAPLLLSGILERSQGNRGGMLYPTWYES
ncbi:MAG: B12-binding domain-containing radical SAM protein [Acidobacteriia bacterium]|nr:B12-binding domain-containing radical SAM protein [Terriglobia bacterium]